jgi:SAM-dependent methyltransferase
MTAIQSRVTRDYYETTARRGHTPTRSHYDDAAAGLGRRLRGWLPSDPQVACLDLACGCGELLYVLEQLGYAKTSGVDLCKEELDQARAFVKGSLHHGDVLEHLHSLADASIGFISALNIVEHLPKARLLEFFEEARRVLRPGGTLVAMVPNALSPFGASTRYWDITHEIAFTPNNFRQIAAATGFADEIDFREAGPVPHGIKSGIRYAMWQCLRGGIAAWFLVEVASTRGGIYTMDMLVRLHAA